MNGLSEMEEYVVKTRLADTHHKSFYYRGTAKKKGITFALDAIIAFSINEAKVMNKEDAIKLCSQLNSEKEILLDRGYMEFEIERKY